MSWKLVAKPCLGWEQSLALAPGNGHRDVDAVAIVKALPLNPWMTTELTPLTPHPSDPATMST